MANTYEKISETTMVEKGVVAEYNLDHIDSKIAECDVSIAHLQAERQQLVDIRDKAEQLGIKRSSELAEPEPESEPDPAGEE